MSALSRRIEPAAPVNESGVTSGALPAVCDDQVRHRLVAQERVGRPHRRPAVLERIPGDTHPRLDVVLVAVDLVAGTTVPDLVEGDAGGIEVHEAVVRLGGRHQEVPADPHLQGYVGADLEVVLHEEAERLLGEVAVDVAEGHGESTPPPGLEVGQARIGERAAVGAEVDVVEGASLTPELEGVAAARVAEGVGEHVGGVGAALREPVGSAEVQPHALNGDLGEDGGRRDPAVDPVALRIVGHVGRERDVDAVIAEARLVHDARAEDTRVVQGADLPVGGPGVPEPGDGVALEVWLAPQILLERVVGVQGVVLRELMADVPRPLVDVHVRDTRADEARGSGGVGAVRGRDQGEQVADDGIGHRRALGVAQYPAVEVQPLALARSLVGREEECLVLDDGPAQVGAELVALERRLGLTLEVEEVPGVEVLVPIELEQLAVERVRARARGDVHHRSRAAPVLRAQGLVVDLELGDGVDRRLEGDLVLDLVVEVDPVDHEVHGVFAVPGGVERKRPLAPEGRGQEAGLAGGHRARNEEPEIYEVAPVEGDLLNDALADHLADRSRGGLDHGRFGRHRDLFGHSTHAELHVEHDRLRDPKDDAVDDLRLEAGQARVELIASPGQGRHLVVAGAVRDDGALDARRLIGGSDAGAGDDPPLRVRDCALERCSGLRPERCDQQQHHEGGGEEP